MAFEIENAKCVHEKGKGVLIEAPDFGEPEWIPQSQITDESEVWKPGDEGTLIITDWLAEQRGWV